MIGYFFFGSKSNGFHMLPYRSVTPSAALTMNVSGIFQPTSTRRDRSAFSRSMTLWPVGVAQDRQPAPCRRASSYRRRTAGTATAPTGDSAVARVHQGQAGAVEVHAVEVLVVDVLARLAAVAVEVQQPVLGVDGDDAAGAEGAGGDRHS